MQRKMEKACKRTVGASICPVANANTNVKVWMAKWIAQWTDQGECIFVALTYRIYEILA